MPSKTKLEWQKQNHRHFCGDEIEISTKLNSSRFHATIDIFLLISSLSEHTLTRALHTVLVSGACPSCSHIFFLFDGGASESGCGSYIGAATMPPSHIFHSSEMLARQSHSQPNTSSFISFYFIANATWRQ